MHSTSFFPAHLTTSVNAGIGYFIVKLLDTWNRYTFNGINPENSKEISYSEQSLATAQGAANHQHSQVSLH